jgi:anti-anti-sigma regulatory factor
MGGGSSAAAGPAPDSVVVGTATTAGSIELDDGALVLRGDIGEQLCDEFRSGGPALGAVDCIDARRVTLLASAGLGLLAAVARARGAGVPLWAGHGAVLGPLRMTGLDDLFDIRAPRT